MKKGFTLIEILVVMGIIAILLTLGTASYATAQKKARDTKRKQDLQDVQNAVEQYYSICGFHYPIDSTGGLPKDLTGSIACADPATTLIATVPSDPLGDPYVVTAADATGTTYTICPPVVRTENGTNYRMEIESCTDVDNNCCISQKQ